jgi:hypothetical protein
MTFPESDANVVRVILSDPENADAALFNAVWTITRGRDYSGTMELSYTNRPAYFNISQGVVTLQLPVPGGSWRRITTDSVAVLQRKEFLL